MLLSPEARPVERYVFDVSGFPTVPQADLATPFRLEGGQAKESGNADKEETIPTEQHEIVGPPIPELEEHFRGVLSRLSTSKGRLRRLPERSSFTVALDLKTASRPPEQVRQLVEGLGVARVFKHLLGYRLSRAGFRAKRISRSGTRMRMEW